MKVIAWFIGIFITMAICLVLVLILWLCGVRDDSAKVDAKSTPSTGSPTKTVITKKKTHFPLVRHGLDKLDEVSKDGRPTTGSFKVATGKAAEKVIEGAKEEEILDGEAKFEEAKGRMDLAEAQKIKDRLEATKRKSKEYGWRITEVKGEIASLSRDISLEEMSMHDRLRSAKQKINLQGVIDSDKGRLSSKEAELSSLEKKKINTSAEVERLTDWLAHPETRVRRYTDGKGVIVEEVEE